MRSTAGAITGTVRDARTHAALENAEIKFVSDVLDESETVSDKSGRFSLDVLMQDGVSFGSVSASRAGYQSTVAQSVYFDALPHVLTIELQPQPSK
jgi:hypothetical protein